MKDKAAINQRFKDAVTFVISENKSENKSTIAEKLEIGKSKLSEILNNRMSIGLEDLAQFIDHFKIDPLWILTGHGKMIRIKGGYIDEEETLNPIKEPDFKEQLIATQSKTISILENTIDDLRKDKDLLRSIIELKMGNQEAS